jgi:hypothetical protein
VDGVKVGAIITRIQKHLEPVEMAFTWYITGISPPYDHVCDIGGIYQVHTWYIPIYFQSYYIPGIYLVYTKINLKAYTWYIPGIYQEYPEGISWL